MFSKKGITCFAITAFFYKYLSLISSFRSFINMLTFSLSSDKQTHTKYQKFERSNKNSHIIWVQSNFNISERNNSFIFSEGTMSCMFKLCPAVVAIFDFWQTIKYNNNFIKGSYIKELSYYVRFLRTRFEFSWRWIGFTTTCRLNFWM